MTTLANTGNIIMDPAILENKALSSAIEKASDYFFEECDALPSDSRFLPPKISWELFERIEHEEIPSAKMTMQNVAYIRVRCEQPHSDGHIDRWQIEKPLKLFMSDYSQTLVIHQLLRKITGFRRAVLRKSIDRLITEIGLEESHAE